MTDLHGSHATRSDEVEALRAAKEYAESIIETVREPLLVLTPDLRVKTANPAFCKHFQVSEEDTLGRVVYELGDGQWDTPDLRNLLEDVLPNNHTFNDFEVRHEFETLGPRIMLLNARRLDHVQLILLGIRDVTEETRSSERLAQTKEYYRTALKNSPVVFARVDRALRYEWIFNPHGDFDAAALERQRDDELEAGPGIDALMALKRRVLESGEQEREAIVFVRSDGDHTYDVTATPVMSPEGRVEHVITAALDITERARAEEALRHSEQRYRALFDSIDTGFYIIEVCFDEDGRPNDLLYRNANPAATRMVGEDYTGRYLTEIDPSFEPYWYEIFGRVAKTGEAVRMEQYAEPLNAWYNFHVFRVGGPESRLVGSTFEDITERKRAADVQRASETRRWYRHRLAELVHPLSDLVAIQRKAARLLGHHLGVDGVAYSESDSVLEALRSGEPVSTPLAEGEAVLDTAEPSAHEHIGAGPAMSVPLIKDGSWVAAFAIYHSQPRTWTDEDLALIRETAELTWAAGARARTEARRREAEERYLALFNAIDQGFCTVKVAFDEEDHPIDYRFLEVSPSFGQQTGIENAEGRWMRDIAGDQDELWFEHYGRVAQNRQPERFEAYSTPLGRWWTVYAFAVGEPHEHRIGVLLRDITARKEAERELERRVEERTREVRQLSESLAVAEQQERQRLSYLLHDDLQQLLYSIQMKLYVVRQEMGRESLEKIQARADRSIELLEQAIRRTRQLTVDLNPPILDGEDLLEAVAWLRTHMRELHALEVEIRTRGEASIKNPERRILLFQVTRELLFNVAKHAGTDRAQVEIRVEEGQVRVAVSDGGPGFDPESVLAMPGKRTGLGLLGARERLRMHGGDLEIQTLLGGGASVIAHVPVG